MDDVKAFLLHYEHIPWKRGEHDCVLFIQKFTQQVYNQPFADPDDYPFHDYKTAYRAFKNICLDNDVESFEAVLDKHYYRIDLPVDGGLVAKEDLEGLTGYSYGITLNGFGFFVGDSGLELKELNPTKDMFWSVN